MKKVMAALLLCLLLPLLAGCDGGQEIETCLFVIGMAVDPAPNGNLTVTIKALSGSQDAQPQTAEGGTGGTGNGEENEIAQAQTEKSIEVAQRLTKELPELFADDPQALGYVQEAIEKARSVLDQIAPGEGQ